MIDSPKYKAAKAAIAEIENGQKLGLGTGSTARYFVDLLGEMVADGFECICVATSQETAKQALRLGIKLSTLDEIDELDITIDGADEVDGQLALIKGGGGALLREKIVADASKRMIVIADHSKMVKNLGVFPLPIEVNKFGLGATKKRVQDILDSFNKSGELKLRKTSDNEIFITDGGHFILDAFFSRILDAKDLSTKLLGVPGVVQHGLFIDMCDTAFIADKNDVKRYDR